MRTAIGFCGPRLPFTSSPGGTRMRRRPNVNSCPSHPYEKHAPGRVRRVVRAAHHQLASPAAAGRGQEPADFGLQGCRRPARLPSGTGIRFWATETIDGAALETSKSSTDLPR
jgi:hypothetical protein